MTTVFNDIGPALLHDVFPLFNVLTRTPTLYRTTEGTPSADGTTAARGRVNAYVNRNTGSRIQQTAAGQGIWAADWIVGAAKTADIQAGDILSDGTRAFVITATPETDAGLLLAPAEPLAELP